MSELYLILHKVRGEATYDIAQRSCPGPRPCQPNCGCWNGERCLMEDDWIIPTSGHGAHPYQTWPLNDLKERYDPICGLNEAEMPKDWPDHYATAHAPEGKGKGKIDMTKLLSALVPKMQRRF